MRGLSVASSLPTHTLQLKMYRTHGVTIHMLLIVNLNLPHPQQRLPIAHILKRSLRSLLCAQQCGHCTELPCLHSANCLHQTRSDSTAHRMQPVRQDSHTDLAFINAQIRSVLFTLLWFTNTVCVSLQSYCNVAL